MTIDLKAAHITNQHTKDMSMLQEISPVLMDILEEGDMIRYMQKYHGWNLREQL